MTKKFITLLLGAVLFLGTGEILALAGGQPDQGKMVSNINRTEMQPTDSLIYKEI